jgi:TolB-like protein/Tfp pilus assembly protein PilF
VTDATEGEREGIWTRLRRRKVVQWGVAYAAGAWGLLQGLEYVSSTFDWPRQLQQLTTLALLMGLPIVLVLAWYHGDRGQQRVSRIELAILTLLFLLGGGLFWRYQHMSAAPESPSVAQSAITSTTSAVATTDRSIAVLPFVNMSADKEQEYFADGISEELLNLLVKVPELRVIARTSSFAFKGKDVGIAEIAQKLNVAHVLEGSVRRSGDTLRITAQLIRASDSSHLWSETYDRRMTDVFEVQDEIASAVVDQLKIKLLGGAPKTRPTDPRAYALYLRARQIARQYTEVALEQSIALYKQAIAIDSSYAAAWVGLATVYVGQVDADFRYPDEGMRAAREALDKALAIEPNFAAAHASLAWIAIFYDRDLAAAAGHLEHALALEPANPDILGVAAVLARRLGRLDQAIAIGEYLVTLDPANPDWHSGLAFAYRFAGRLDEAISESRTVLSLSPDYIWGRRVIGEILLQKGDAHAALLEMQQESDEQARMTGLAMVYHALGRKTESDATLADAIEKFHKTSAHPIAVVLAFRGEDDRAFEWLNKAVQHNDPDLGATALQPMLARLHSDSRWLPFLRENGMAPEQLAAIKFNVTLPK